MYSFEDQYAGNRRVEYEKGYRKYLAHIANNNPQMHSNESVGLWYRVQVDD